MSKADKPSVQDEAINEYLQSLLMEVTEETEPVAPTEIKLEPVQEKSEPIIEHDEPVEKPVIGLEQLVAEVPEVIAETITEVKTTTVSEVELETQIESDLPLEDDSAVPEWAQTRFQCLLFKVSGLSLAVPLVKLNSVVPWDEDITITPNQTSWYLGLIQHLRHQIKIIDTALLVMPENRRQLLAEDSLSRLSHILLVDDYKWGLACDSIGEVIWLSKDDVKWRKNKTTRAWLAGTSLEHLCAVMDTEVFAQMLNKQV